MPVGCKNELQAMTAGGEHVAKFNRFIRIEEELRENGGALAEYPGIGP